jgi:low temperature requirement protein LtrA
VLDTTQAGLFMVSRQDLFFLCLGTATFRFENTAFSAVFAPVLLTAARIMSVFDDILTVTISTSIYNHFAIIFTLYYISLQVNHYRLAHPIPGRRLQSENVPFDADHMLERCRLFLLIAVGETVFTTGTAIAAAPTMLMTLVAGTFALAGTVALWALSFGRSHWLIIRHLEKTSDPIRTSRHEVSALMVMIAELIVVAVANEIVIAHPLGDASFVLSLLLGGGPMLFLAAQGWYLWAVPNIRSQLHLIGWVTLLFVGLATLAVPPYVSLILVGASLTALAIFDQQMTK